MILFYRMSDEKDFKTPNNYANTQPMNFYDPRMFYPNFNPYPLNQPIPHNTTNVNVQCTKCTELQNEIKLMGKNIELLNEQIKLLDMKISITKIKDTNIKNNDKNNNNNNVDENNNTHTILKMLQNVDEITEDIKYIKNTLAELSDKINKLCDHEKYLL